jgi:tetratricopeptide (TPR) repeat protein
MADYSSTSIQPPKDWQAFERNSRVLFMHDLQDPLTKTNGRSGQRQNGVDIYGRRGGNGALVGIQCKGKNAAYGKPVTENELRREVQKALEFKPALDEFILITTAPYDQKIEETARLITKELETGGRRLRAAVWGWDTLEQHISQHRDPYKAFHPDATPISDEILAKLDQLLADKHATDFERSALEAEIAHVRGSLLVKDRAIEAFLRDVGETPLKPESYPDQLKRFAERYRQLLVDADRRTNLPGHLEALRMRAKERIEAGFIEEAEAILAKLTMHLRQWRSDQQQMLDQAMRDEATVLAERARISEARLRYEEAAALYGEAASTVPTTDAELKWLYTLRRAEAFRQLGEQFGDNNALSRAIVILRDEVLPLAPRERVPLDWAITQNNLGNALSALGECGTDTARLKEAVAAYQEALKEFTRGREPLRWAGTQNNLGNALRALGECESSTVWLRQALVAYHKALKEWTRQSAPRDWAGAQLNLSNVLSMIAEHKTGTYLLKKALVACRNAFKEFTRERLPLQWAATQHKLGIALQMLGARQRNTARLKRAIAAYQKALIVRTRERGPIDWAMTQNNLGNASLAIGGLETGIVSLEKAVAAYDEAFNVFTPEHTPLLWAMTQYNLADACCVWGDRENGTARLDRAVAAYDKARKVYHEHLPQRSAMITGKQGVALMLLAERLGDLNTARIAVYQISFALTAMRGPNNVASAAYFETVRARAVALLNQLTRRSREFK